MARSDKDVERTEDGRFLVIDGRRWRATDPLIPEERQAELRSVLMAWRRDVGRTKGTDEERRSRDGVQAAKVALGERGEYWWDRPEADRLAQAEDALRDLEALDD